MGFSLLVALLAATSPAVHGHFRVMRIAHNGVWQDPIRYIRNITSPFAEMQNPDSTQYGLDRGWSTPSYYIDLAESQRCGRDNMRHAPNTETLKVMAGDTLEFAWAGLYPYEFNAKNLNCEDGRGFCEIQEGTGNRYMSNIIHSGPVSIYLSAVPEGTEIGEYDGSGEWVKIYTAGGEILKGRKLPHWLPNNNDDEHYATGTQNFPVRMPFKIPEQTPAGEYLLRVDLVFNTWQVDYAQTYPSCAHIEVTSAASGPLPSGVKFPEVYRPDMPGMKASTSHGVGLSVDPDYVYPGGDLWTGKEMIVDRPDLTPK